MSASLVKRILAAAVDGSVPTTQVVRLARVLAAKIGTAEIREWLELETKGYDEKLGREIPSYRVVQGTLMAFTARGWLVVRGNSVLTQKSVDRASETPLAHSISEIEALTKGGDLVMVEYTGEQERVLQMFLPSASKVGVQVPANQFQKIVDRVRDAVLDWALQLDQAGVSGEGLPLTEEQERLAASAASSVQTFISNFYGELRHVQIQQGSPGAAQWLTLGDLAGVAELVKALRESLGAIQVPDADRKVLKENVEVLETALQSPSPVLPVVKKALAAIGTLAGGVVSGYIATKYQISIDHLILQIENLMKGLKS